ncbi:MAG TPA: helix-turn-helix domain-containing protein [Bryobacteraceae bacterium]|nr:helix-turn-helix domain-containing protein [Bryobacteraceae bacterium]
MKESFDALIDHLVAGGFFLEEAVEILEKGMIARALEKTSQNQSEASKALGIHRNTLQRKMTEYGIDGKHPRRKPVTRAKATAKTATRRGRRAS